MSDNKFTRSEIIRKLKTASPRTVKFKKADKTMRTMVCTLNEEMIPSIDGSLGGENKEVVTAYDTEKNGWRSFRVDAVRSIT